jgi:sugar lactone lactonase YvrE
MEKGMCVLAVSRVGLLSLVLVVLSSSGLAQTITTYVGPPLPVNGAPAITQVIDQPSSVVPDGAGGFYVSSSSQSRVYKVAANGAMSSVAGNGTTGFSGDGGLAISAQLNHQGGVAVDAAGNLYIADTSNNCIRKVASGGVISTIAGIGTSGFSGDGGPATSAQLYLPSSVAVDAAGNLYITEFSSRIRKVTSGGVISTVAGNGTRGFSGDGGPATSAQVFGPSSVAVDVAGILYIADTGNHRIRKVTPDGVISTVAGNGTAGFSGDGGPATSAQLGFPLGVAVDAAGNLYVADVPSHIRRVTPDGVISTVAGNGTGGFSGDGGPATSAQLYVPSSVAVDAAGNLYIADQRNSRIRKVTRGGLISTVAGTGTISGDGGPATSAQLNSPGGIALDVAGNLYIADSSNNRIRKVTADGVISTVAGNGILGFSGDGGPATWARLNSPYGVAVDVAGILYIADTGNSRIRKVTADGVISTVAGNGIWGFGGDGGPATSAQLNSPDGVAVDWGGNLYIADSTNGRIRKVNAGGVISTVAGNGNTGFGGDGGPATSAQLSFPSGVALDAAGNLYIADTINNRIRKVNAGGVISTVAGNYGNTGFGGDGGLAISAHLYLGASWTDGVAADAVGNLYIADSGNSRIRKVTADGVISTVAGNGIWGFGGDGGPATSAQLYLPGAVAVDVAGNLYIADTMNNRIRKVGASKMSRAGSFAQIASGGGWKTTLTLVNLSGTPVTAHVIFYSDAGTMTAVPLVLPDGSRAMNSVADLTIPPRGSAVIESEGATAFVNVGWADVEASGPLSGYTIFRERISGVPDSEGTAPLETASASSIVFSYDNTGGFQTGVALVNLSASDCTCTALFRDENGNQIGSSQFTLVGSGHTSFFVNSQFIATANRRGIIEFQNPSGGITGVGLRFSPSGSFTSAPIIR